MTDQRKCGQKGKHHDKTQVIQKTIGRSRVHLLCYRLRWNDRDWGFHLDRNCLGDKRDWPEILAFFHPMQRGVNPFGFEIEQRLAFLSLMPSASNPHFSKRIDLDRLACGLSPGMVFALALCRSMLDLAMYSRLFSDLRMSFRGLIGKLGFTLTVTITLALGIGVNVAVFSLFHQLLVQALPVLEPERLVNLSSAGPRFGRTSNTGIGPRESIFSYPMYRDLEAQQKVFTGVAAHRDMSVNLAFGGQSLAGVALLVSPQYFPVLQLQPALGRLIGPQDDQGIGKSPIAVLSHHYWKTKLAGNPAVIDQAINLNGVALTIVGIAPAEFSSTTLGSQPDVFVPISSRWLLAPKAPKDDTDRSSHWLYLFARLQPGVSAEQASSQVNQIFSNLINQVEAPLQSTVDQTTMAQFKARQLRLAPGERGQSSLSAHTMVPLTLLSAVAAMLLLVACLNTANLLLVRGASRVGELALRASIGAGKAQLVREQLLEAVILALLAGLLSLPLAWLCLRGMIGALPMDSASSFIDPSLDWAAMRFALLVALSTVLVFGLFPAFQAAETAPILSLRSAQQPGGSRASNRFRTLLATAQIAFSMASLVMAGLFIQSLANVSRVDLGMKVESIATLSLAPDRNGYDSVKSDQLFARFEEAFAALPGVSSVTTSMVPILQGADWSNHVSVQGVSRENRDDGTNMFNEIGTGYFRTLDIPMLAGRDISDADALDRPKVAVVNRSFAKKYGLGEGSQVLGKRMALGDSDELNIEIVGLVEDSRYNSVKLSNQAQYFLPRRQNAALGSMNFYVRSELAPESLLPLLAKTAASIDPDLPVETLTTLAKQIRSNLAIDHFISLLTASFAILATLLAAGGVYGMLSFALTQRTREIGLRLALGAQPARIRSALFAQVGRLFAVGGGIGLLLAIGLGHSAQALLFELNGYDPRVLLSATLVLAIVAFAAASVPAFRASRTNPLIALRS